MEIRIIDEGIGLSALLSDDKYILIERPFKDSRLYEGIVFKLKNDYVEVYFLIAYGELRIFKKFLERKSMRSYRLLNNKLISMLEKSEFKLLRKYCINLLIKYERLLFNKLYEERYN
ncbi:MAG: hypothetical protein QXO21_00410 [Candidatus Anstonellales archaeon]